MFIVESCTSTGCAEIIVWTDCALETCAKYGAITSITHDTKMRSSKESWWASGSTSWWTSSTTSWWTLAGYWLDILNVESEEVLFRIVAERINEVIIIRNSDEVTIGIYKQD